MNGKLTVALLVLTGCADVIGADFGGKTLDMGGQDAGGATSQAGGASTSPDGSLVINEICATDRATFVELYNAGSATIELSDYRLVNGRGGSVLSDRRSLSGSLAPGAFHVSADDCDRSYCDLSFDGTGDTLELRERASGNVLDSVQYPSAEDALDDDASLSRLPNGTGNFAAGAPTPGELNEPAAP